MKKTILLLVLLASAGFLKAQSAPSVDWYYSTPSSLNGGGEEDWIYDIFETSTTGEYLFGGYNENSTIYRPVIALCDNSGLIWETKVADAGIIRDVLEADDGTFFGIGNGPDPHNSNEPSILIAHVASNGTVIAVNYINHYTLTTLSSSYTIEGWTMVPVIENGNIIYYVISATYDDLTYGLIAGTVVMRLDTYGDLDQTFNSGDGFRAFHMHPGYPSSVPPFSETVVYGRPYAIMAYGGAYTGIVVAGSEAPSSTDDVTGVFVEKITLDGAPMVSCSDNPIYESVLSGSYSYTDNNTSPSPQCSAASAYSFIDAGPYPYDNENDNAKAGGLVQSSNNGDIILGLQLDYYFMYYVSCGFSPWSPPSYINTDFTLVDLDLATLDIQDAVNVGRFTAIDYSTPMVDDGNGFTILGGQIDDSGPDSYMNNYLIKVDYTFGSVWDQAYFGDGDYINCPFGMGLTSDGGYILGGNNDWNDEDYNIIKLTSPGPRLSNPNSAVVNNDIIKNELTIECPGKTAGRVCNIYAMDGRLVQSSKVPDGLSKFTVNYAGVTDGIYIVEVMKEGEVLEKEKFIVNRN